MPLHFDQTTFKNISCYETSDFYNDAKNTAHSQGIFMVALLNPTFRNPIEGSTTFPAFSGTIDMGHVATIILGGGQGTRLFPLTETRCKPAMPIAGKYRLIDIPISNALNSGSQKIFILTQFLSNSLHQHIFSTYRSSSFVKGSIELLTAEQGPKKTWFQGTADAVRQNLHYFHEIAADYFLILSGDQLYNMNFVEMVKFAKETDVDLVIAAQPITETDAKRMGVLKLNEDHFITEFCEKPQDAAILNHMRLPESTLKQLGNSSEQPKEFLGSMGIYLFKRQALFDLLQQDHREDFGKHIIPTKVSQGSVAAYLYEGYWEDIGTIRSYFQANLALTASQPPFNCYDERNPILSHPSLLPPPKVSQTQLKDTIICEGCIVDAESISSSILGPRTVIKRGTIVRNSYIMGHDFYTPPKFTKHLPFPLHIGEHCVIENAIIDKHVHIGNHVKLINKKGLMDYTDGNVYIRDGVIIVTAGACLPDGFSL